jgi:hypothetical protein
LRNQQSLGAGDAEVGLGLELDDRSAIERHVGPHRRFEVDLIGIVTGHDADHVGLLTQRPGHGDQIVLSPRLQREQLLFQVIARRAAVWHERTVVTRGHSDLARGMHLGAR